MGKEKYCYDKEYQCRHCGVVFLHGKREEAYPIDDEYFYRYGWAQASHSVFHQCKDGVLGFADIRAFIKS